MKVGHASLSGNSLLMKLCRMREHNFIQKFIRLSNKRAKIASKTMDT